MIRAFACEAQPMRFRDLAPTVVPVCSFVAAIWSPLAWMAFLEAFPRGWQPGFQHTAWTNFQGLFSVTALPFMPGGFLVGGLLRNDLVGFVIGGAIEGALAGVVLTFLLTAGSRMTNRATDRVE